MKKAITVFIILISSQIIFSQTASHSVDVVGRLSMTLPTASAIDGLGGQIGLRFSTEYSTRRFFGFEAVFDNRRYSNAASNTKLIVNAKNLQLGVPFIFGNIVQVTIMPCISIRMATKATIEQGSKKVQVPNNILENSAISDHDKSIVVGLSKKTSNRIALTCSGQYVFSATEKSIIQVGLSYQL